jgi:hypothetical protein
VGAPFQDLFTSKGGMTVLIFGSSTINSSHETSITDLSRSQGHLYYGEAKNNYFGTSVAYAGDFNGDGFGDVIMSAKNKKKVYVAYSGLFIPTSIPTPTPTVSHSPTSLPSMAPTQVPTVPPSLSTVPSHLPTPSPSPRPSAVPTVNCVSGTYFNGVRCIECLPGYFSSFDSPQNYPSSCTLCPVGKFSVGFGNRKCTTCGGGTLSTADRTGCQSCVAGQYAKNGTECAACEEGKYAPQPLTDSCISCDAGFYTNSKHNATTCTKCDAGYYSHRNTSVTCLACPPGQHSASGASSCTECTTGFYAENEGSVSCTACPAGKAASTLGSSNCTSCPLGKSQGSTGASSCSDCTDGYIADSIGETSCTACNAGTYADSLTRMFCTACVPGKSQGATGQTKCDDCKAGTYANEEGSTTCLGCDVGKSSTTSSASCDLAAANYFLYYPSGEMLTCPKHSVCKGERIIYYIIIVYIYIMEARSLFYHLCVCIEAIYIKTLTRALSPQAEECYQFQ